MPDATIVNVKDAWGAPHFTPQGARVVMCNNNSGGTLFAGDVVVIATNGIDVTTTTTAVDKTVYGIVAPSNATSLRVGDTTTDTYASGALCPIIPISCGAVARVNIAANTVAVGDVLVTTTAAKVAGTQNTVATFAGGALGIALESQAAKDANNCIRVLLKSA